MKCDQDQMYQFNRLHSFSDEYHQHQFLTLPLCDCLWSTSIVVKGQLKIVMHKIKCEH